MKGLISLLLCAVALSLGCGGDSASTPRGSPPVPPPPPDPAPVPAPPSPKGLKVSEVGADFLEWTWNPVTGAAGYEAHFSFFEDFGTYSDPLASLDASQTSFRRDGINTSTKGHLRVRSLSSSGERSAWTAHVTGETAAGTTPPPPKTTPATGWPDPTECVKLLQTKLEFAQPTAVYPDPLLAFGMQFHYDCGPIPPGYYQAGETPAIDVFVRASFFDSNGLIYLVNSIDEPPAHFKDRVSIDSKNDITRWLCGNYDEEALCATGVQRSDTVGDVRVEFTWEACYFEDNERCFWPWHRWPDE